MNISQLCEYGCGREGQHQFKNGKWWTPEKRKLFGKEMLKRWKDPDYVNTMKKSRQTTPNKQEIKLQQILDNLFPEQYIFVGDLS